MGILLLLGVGKNENFYLHLTYFGGHDKEKYAMIYQEKVWGMHLKTLGNTKKNGEKERYAWKNKSAIHLPRQHLPIAFKLW